MLLRALHWGLPVRPSGWLLAFVCLTTAAAGAYFLDRVLPDPRGRPPVIPPGWAQELAQRWRNTALAEGSRAPEFSLPSLRGGGKLGPADFRGRRPVVLVFGSFSCDFFCSDVGRLERLYRHYRGRVGFLFVSVKEAGHGLHGLEFVLRAEDSPGQHLVAVRKAARIKGLTMPGVVDLPDRRVMRAYRAFPRRLVVVDRQGRVALDLGTGGFDLSRVEKWVRGHTPAAGDA